MVVIVWSWILRLTESGHISFMSDTALRIAQFSFQECYEYDSRLASRKMEIVATLAKEPLYVAFRYRVIKR